MITTLSNSQIKEIQESNAELKLAIDKRYEIFKRLFVPNVILYWLSSSGHLQTGIVIECIGSSHYPRLRVRNSTTGKIVDVDLFRVAWDVMELDEDVE